MTSPFLILSSSIMLTSTLMSISSSNWLFLWAALELNLLSFIPIMMYSKKSQETEAAVKYFLVQALGSSMLLMSSMSMWSTSNTPNQYMSFLMFMALVLKMGMAPCHMWYPSVMTSISWVAALILSTWQKLAPLMIVTFMFSNSLTYMMLFIAGLNAITGGLMGMNQSHLRTIMAYSSITHMGWMMSLISMFKPMATMMYFILYTTIICPMFLMMQMKNITNSNNLNKIMLHSPMFKFMIPIILLSLSGIPPLSGFVPKWMTISLISTISPTITIVLIIGAMMNTYFYLNVAFNFMLSMKYSMINMLPYKQTSFTTLSWLALALLFISPTLMLL